MSKSFYFDPQRSKYSLSVLLPDGSKKNYYSALSLDKSEDEKKRRGDRDAKNYVIRIMHTSILIKKLKNKFKTAWAWTNSNAGYAPQLIATFKPYRPIIFNTGESIEPKSDFYSHESAFVLITEMNDSSFRWFYSADYEGFDIKSVATGMRNRILRNKLKGLFKQAKLHVNDDNKQLIAVINSKGSIDFKTD